MSATGKGPKPKRQRTLQDDVCDSIGANGSSSSSSSAVAAFPAQRAALAPSETNTTNLPNHLRNQGSSTADSRDIEAAETADMEHTEAAEILAHVRAGRLRAAIKSAPAETLPAIVAELRTIVKELEDAQQPEQKHAEAGEDAGANHDGDSDAESEDDSSNDDSNDDSSDGSAGSEAFPGAALGAAYPTGPAVRSMSLLGLPNNMTTVALNLCPFLPAATREGLQLTRWESFRTGRPKDSKQVRKRSAQLMGDACSACGVSKLVQEARASVALLS
eukprot:g12022.t1